MPRTPVKPQDLMSAIVTALNGLTVNGGTISAKQNGQAITIVSHTDAAPPCGEHLELFIH